MLSHIIRLIILSFFLFSKFSFADDKVIFSNFKDLNECVGSFKNFSEYKTNFKKCLDSKDINISKDDLNFLSQDKIKISDYKNINDLPKLIKKSPNYIYAVDRHVRSLTAASLSQLEKNKLLLTSYNNFNPKLFLTSKSESSDLNNAIMGFGAIFAINEIINADDTKTVSLSTDVSSIAENSSSTITITATLSASVTSATTVNLSTSGTATSGTDYTAVASSITIPGGSTTASTTFTLIDDSISDVDETVIISISSLTGQDVSVGTSSSTVTITDNESVPSISLSSSASSIAENSGSSITLTATSSIISSAAVEVSLSASGTSTSGTDYGAISSITIPAGSTTATASFTPTDDSVYEGASETAIFDVSSVSGGSAVENGTQQVTLTITENESAPTVTLSTSASSIAENSSSSVTITATLSGATDEDVTVPISTSGTSTEGTDYGTITLITISAGNTSGTTSLTPTDDAIYEGNETAILDIASVSGGGATENGTQQETITITDNESAPTVTLSASASTIAENSGDTITLTATLSTATTANVTVSIDVSGVSEGGGDINTISDIVISAGDTTGTATFTPIDNAFYDGDLTAVIDVGSISGGSATESGTQQVSISLTDNETAPTVSLSSDATSITENSSGSITLTATLSGTTTAAVTVTLGTAGTSVEGTDYSNLSTITITTGQLTGTTTFTPTDDVLSEGSETAIISITGVSGADTPSNEATEDGDQQVTLTIVDDESVPSISLSSSASSIAENSGSSITLTVTSSITSASNIEVSLSASGTATSGTDYGAISSITIPAGSTTATASFTPTDDSIYDGGNETAIFDISSVSGGSAEENGTQQVTLTITENESAPTVALSSSASSITENSGSSVTLTATLSGATYQDVTVSISTSGTGTEGTDYASVSDITISAGSTTGTATLTPTDDSTYEGNETAIIDISGVSGGGVTENGTQQETITITDNESAPTVALSTSASSIAENSLSSLTLTATLSGATYQDVTVSISTSGTGTEGTDYGAISDITISAGSTTGTATLTPTDDSTYEGNETAIIDISGVSGGGASESGTQQETITITENESAPTVTLSTSATTTSENSGGSLTLTATLSNATTANVTVSIGTSGTATEGTDYGVISDITITAGNTTGTTSFTPTDDASSEGNETATVSITGVSGGSASENGTQAVTITITDDETTPTVTLTSSASSIAENSGSSITLTATLSVAASENVTVNLETTVGSALSGTDFSAVSDITILAGNTTGTSTFTPLNDNIYEINETATIEIATVSGGSASENGSQSVTLTITNDETAPTVALSTSASSIAENSLSSLTLTATLSGATYQDVTVSISTSGTGTEGTDYGAISDITISAGSTTGTATLTPTDDSTYEGNETAIIDISGVSGGGASESGTQQETITITENESAPTVTLSTSATTTSENSGGSLTLTATLSNATTANVTVSIGTSGTATEGTDYGVISDITITAGNTTGTSSFTPTDDESSEGNETATVSITGVSGGSASENGTQAVTITITDDDTTPTVTLTSNASSIAENSGSSITLTVSLSTADSSDVTISFSTSGTSSEGSDYQNISDMTISAGDTSGTVSFTPSDDNTVEGDETAIIDISVSGGNAVENGTQQLTLTITDNEVAPTVSLSASASTIDEASGGSITLTARLSNTSDQNVTVGLTGSGTATAGSDYSSLSNITITAGNTTGTTSFTPISDTSYETSSGGTPESATIDISSVSGGSATENGTQQVTISITEKALNSGTQLTYNATTASTYASTTDFSQVNFHAGISAKIFDTDQNDNGVLSVTTETMSTQNPFAIINAHKAAGYGLDGSGKTIAIVDSAFENSHFDISGKTIDTFGTLKSANASNGSHGLAVTGIASGIAGNGGIAGVAPGADLHLTDTGSRATDGYSNRLTHLKAYTDDASTAVVQNNSWGLGVKCGAAAGTSADNACENFEIDNVLAVKSSVGVTADQTFAFYATGNINNANDAANAVTSMNNFQNHGVIVFALDNDNKRDEAHLFAALPELYEELKEAWITAINIDVKGDAGSETYTRRSGQCGSTAEYCLGADGYGITTAKHGNSYTLPYDSTDYTSGGDPVYYPNHGSSWVAPQISGAIAILAQAFPNQSPEIWTDRLLASANNDWFSHNGQVTFGNGVQHGYSTEYGHGIMDIYAALQPITTSSYTASMRVRSLSGEIKLIPLKVTIISLSESFGDSLKQALSEKKGYLYDALDGGFKYDLASHVVMKITDDRPFKLEQEFSLLGKNFDEHKIKLQKGAKNSFAEMKDEQNFFATLHSSALPVQSFTGENAPNYLGFYSELAPYFNTKNNGLAIGGKMDAGEGSRILWGISTPMKQSDSETIGRNMLTSISYENQKQGSYKNSILFGIMEEDDTVLESELQGAFATENNTTITNFVGLSSEARISDKTLFRASASIGSSELNMDYSPMIKNTSKIISDNFSMNLSHQLDEQNTTAVFSVSQPNRISSGNMDIAISNLYDSDGNVTFENHNLSLVPTGRQIDIGLGLRKKVSDDFEYILKYKNTTNPGHVNDAESTHNISAVSRFGNYKLGFTSGTGRDSDSFELKYSLDF